MNSEGSGVGVGIVHVQGAVENLNFPFLSPLELFYITVYAAHDRLKVFVLPKAASGRDVNSAPRTLLLPYAQAFLETFGTESMKALHDSYGLFHVSKANRTMELRRKRLHADTNAIIVLWFGGDYYAGLGVDIPENKARNFDAFHPF